MKASACAFNFYPVGRSSGGGVQNRRAVRFQHGDSISPSISVEIQRYTPVFQTGNTGRATLMLVHFLATRITGVSQDFTGLVAAVQQVQLRLRVAFGLQALQRCSGLLNRRARGSTVATHHFADVAQQRQQQFRKLPGALPHESANLSIGSI